MTRHALFLQDNTAYKQQWDSRIKTKLTTKNNLHPGMNLIQEVKQNEKINTQMKMNQIIQMWKIDINKGKECYKLNN